MWELFAAKLAFCAPLAYIGSVMIADPAWMAGLPAMAATGILNLTRLLRGLPPEPADVAPVEEGAKTVRIAGVALCVATLMVFIAH